jgi:hypothetical protein
VDAVDVLRWHERAGWALIVVSAVAGGLALAAHFVPALRSRWIWAIVWASQLLAFVPAVLGVILVSRYDIELDSMHALYGFSAIIAVGILYSYRTSSFLQGKEWLLYGVGCLFIMGLGLRNLTL